MALLKVEDLRTYFHSRGGVARAVDGVSFAVEPGETVGLVGESGSGKSVLCYSLLGLIPMPPGRIESGHAWFGDGVDLLNAPRREVRRLLGNRVAMVFQDPMTALNPYLRVGAQVVEPLIEHGVCGKVEARRRAVEALRAVAIRDAEALMEAYPHHLSGGMRQRVMIAMAMVTEPDLLIADEPTTALDVSVQAQILAQMRELQRRCREAGGAMSILFITHDLGVVAGLCQRVLVMYGGKIVESGTAEAVYETPAHPYTRALLRAVPCRATDGGELYSIPGQPPDPASGWEGCPFAPRCEYAAEVCLRADMALREVAPGHATACARVTELDCLASGAEREGA